MGAPRHRLRRPARPGGSGPRHYNVRGPVALPAGRRHRRGRLAGDPPPCLVEPVAIPSALVSTVCSEIGPGRRPGWRTSTEEPGRPPPPEYPRAWRVDAARTAGP